MMKLFLLTIKPISVTMKLFFLEKFHCDFRAVKRGKFESSNFDFRSVDFDTMKFISFSKAPKSLVLGGF